MPEEREPVASNIYDAMNHMKKQIEQHEALIDTSQPLVKWIRRDWRYAWSLISTIITLLWWLILGTPPMRALLFSGPIVAIVLFTIMNTDTVYNSRREITRLTPLLADLEKLSQYDENMDVGFKLDGRGNFDQIILEAMMKKREQEIKQQARAGR